jgi:hypothetical protein
VLENRRVDDRPGAHRTIFLVVGDVRRRTDLENFGNRWGGLQPICARFRARDRSSTEGSRPFHREPRCSRGSRQAERCTRACPKEYARPRGLVQGRTNSCFTCLAYAAPCSATPAPRNRACLVVTVLRTAPRLLCRAKLCFACLALSSLRWTPHRNT